MDKEHEPPGKNDTTPATKSHRLASALSTFGARVIAINLEHPDFTLVECAKIALNGDPTLATTIRTLLQGGTRGPQPAVQHPCTTLFNLAQGSTDTLHKVTPTLHKVSQVRATAARVALTPTTTTVTVDHAPLKGEHGSPPTGEMIPSPASPARQRDALIDAWAEVFGKGDYRNLSDREMGQVLKANVKLRNMAQRTDRTVEDMAAGVLAAAHNWPNVMTGNRTMSIALIVDNWGALVHGPQTKGRSNGNVVTNYINRSGTVRHEESFSQMAARKERRD